MAIASPASMVSCARQAPTASGFSGWARRPTIPTRSPPRGPIWPAASPDRELLANYTHQTRRWVWNARAASVSPDFRADAGFVPQVGTQSYSAGLGRIFVGGSGRRFDEISLYSGCDRTTDWSGMRASWGCDNEVSYTGPMQTTLTYNAAPNFDYYRGVTYNDFRHNIDATIRPNGAFNLFLDSSFGHAIDFTNVRHARRIRYTAGSSLQRLRSPDWGRPRRGRTDAARSRATGFTSPESRKGQANYHFTPRAYARVISSCTPTSPGTSGPICSRSRHRPAGSSRNCSSATRSIRRRFSCPATPTPRTGARRRT